MKLYVALLVGQLVGNAFGFAPATHRPRLVQVKPEASPKSLPLSVATSTPSLSSVRLLAANSNSAALQPPSGGRSFVRVLRRAKTAAATQLMKRLSLVQSALAAFARQHRLRARTCTFLAGCVFAFAASAPMPAHAMDAPLPITPGLPIQEKIARQHEAWVYKQQMAVRDKMVKFAMFTPVLVVVSVQVAKVLIKYSEYQDNSVMEDDIALYGEYIAPDATAAEDEEEGEEGATDEASVEGAEGGEGSKEDEDADDESPPSRSKKDGDLL